MVQTITEILSKRPYNKKQTLVGSLVGITPTRLPHALGYWFESR